jgi:hypothetical protein
MVETPIYDGLVSELGDTLAEVRALFSQHVIDEAPTDLSDETAAVAA